MSLVVAALHDDGISLVGDTKITYGDDEGRTRRVYKNALPKLMVLSDQVAVGYAGRNPPAVLRSLVQMRDAQAERVLDAADELAPETSLVVASLSPSPRLWQVTGEGIEDRSSIGRAWVGDHSAYEHFQRRYDEWPAEVDHDFRLMSSLQWLLTFKPVATVGGYRTHITTEQGAFRFAAGIDVTAPWLLEVRERAVEPDALTLRLGVPVGGDPTHFQVLSAVGRPPTIGAFAYLVPQASYAVLFPHATPWQPIEVRTSSMRELVRRAEQEHGQIIAGPRGADLAPPRTDGVGRPD